MALLAHTDHFIAALSAAKDDNPEARDQRGEFVGQLKAFVSAWKSLNHNYLDPPPCRPKFTDLLGRLESDNWKIVLDLQQKLSGAISLQEQARTVSRLYVPRNSCHTLVTFFGNRLVQLRQKQIVYATTVVKLVSLIIIHVNKKEHKYSNPNDRKSAREAQREAITLQRQAKQELQHLVPDNLVQTDLWLEGFNWTDEPDRLPLGLAADRWFDTALLEQRIPDPRPRDTDYNLYVAQLRKDMEGLEARINVQRQEDRTMLECIEKDWDDRYEKQIKKSQKLEQALQATNTKLEEYRYHYRILYDKYEATQELSRKQMLENECLVRELRQSEREKQDLEYLTNSLEVRLRALTVDMAELEKENASIKREKEALGAETRSLHAAKACIEAEKQALELNGQVTGVRDAVPSSRTQRPSANPHAVSQQRGRPGLQTYRSAPADNTNKNTYPPVSYSIASHLQSGRERGLRSASVLESSSNHSSAIPRTSSYIIANSTRTSSLDSRPRRERADSSCDPQSRRDHIPVLQPRGTSDKHESDAGSSQSRDSRRRLGGHREERHDLASEQGQKPRARDYQPSTKQTRAPFRTTSYRSDEFRARHQKSLPEPVPTQLRAQSVQATSNIGAIFDH